MPSTPTKTDDGTTTSPANGQGGDTAVDDENAADYLYDDVDAVYGDVGVEGEEAALHDENGGENVDYDYDEEEDMVDYD